jgi:hypothetical protein
MVSNGIPKFHIVSTPSGCLSFRHMPPGWAWEEGQEGSTVAASHCSRAAYACCKSL